MFTLIYRLLNLALTLFELLLLAHVILSWVRPVSNQWTTLIDRIVSPVLDPIRRFLRDKLPQLMGMLDFSPVVCYFLIEIARNILRSLLW